MSAVMWKEVRNMESRVLIGILDSRWRLLGNVVFSDRRIMDVAFLISLTNKNFFMISPPPPHSCLFLVLWFVFFRRLIALTFAGNTCLMNVSVVFVLDFQSLINRLCAKFHIAIFSPSCCLYCLFEQSTAHISFWVRFAIFVLQFVGFPRTWRVDVNHPRATKSSLVLHHFQKCFHRRALILFQCVVLAGSQPPFATI